MHRCPCRNVGDRAVNHVGASKIDRNRSVEVVLLSSDSDRSRLSEAKALVEQLLSAGKSNTVSVNSDGSITIHPVSATRIPARIRGQSAAVSNDDSSRGRRRSRSPARDSRRSRSLSRDNKRRRRASRSPATQAASRSPPRNGGSGRSKKAGKATLAITNAIAGAIIGKRGSNISEIEHASGARVTVSPLQQNTNERTITMAGAEDQITAARRLIQQRIDAFGNNFRASEARTCFGCRVVFMSFFIGNNPRCRACK